MVNAYIQKWYGEVRKVKNAKDREIQHSSWPCSSSSLLFAIPWSYTIPPSHALDGGLLTEQGIIQ